MLGTWFHAVQLSTTFISSRKFVYLPQCSAIVIRTDSSSFTACCQVISPYVGTLLTFFYLAMKGLISLIIVRFQFWTLILPETLFDDKEKVLQIPFNSHNFMEILHRPRFTRITIKIPKKSTSLSHFLHFVINSVCIFLPSFCFIFISTTNYKLQIQIIRRVNRKNF